MATFASLKNNLRLLTMGGLGLTNSSAPDDTYGLLVNRAYESLFEAYQWSFRLSNTVVNSVAPKTQGTVTLQQGSPAILGTGTAFTLSDVGAFLWPGNVGGTPLPISDVSGPQLATLANPYAGATQINTSYTVAPLYYQVRGAAEVLDVVSTDWKLQKRLREEIWETDPTMTDMGGAPALWWCEGIPSPDGSSMMIQLYPTPADYRAYLITYRRRCPVLIRDGDVPLIKGSLIEERATITACEMMAASTGQQSWFTIRDLHHQNLYGNGGNDIGQLQEELSRDLDRVAYRANLTNPGPLASGYDSVLSPTHAGQDDWNGV